MAVRFVTIFFVSQHFCACINISCYDNRPFTKVLNCELFAVKSWILFVNKI